jgi:methionyl-tRNA formyltransferase
MWEQQGGTPMHFKVLRTRLTEEAAQAAPGAVRMEDGRLFLACADQWLELLVVQPEGRRRMPASDFVHGIRTDGTVMIT